MVHATSETCSGKAYVCLRIEDLSEAVKQFVKSVSLIIGARIGESDSCFEISCCSCREVTC